LGKREFGPELLNNRSVHRDVCGFTLMEMLLALAVSAIVLAAMGGVFYSAIRLRERTTALLEETTPVRQALAFLRRDLQGALPPGGLLAGDFKCGAVNSGIGATAGLQFSTTTGTLQDNVPYGDVQEVTYELRDPVIRTNRFGKELIRTVSRNLLSSAALDYGEQFLLSNVQTLQFECFDGMEWREFWDTSLNDTNLPNAVRVRIELVAENIDYRYRQPMEMVIPLMTQSRTNQAQQASGGGE
jgi:prepilin-type N-terminal cleavage/methylation domain-containing protein